MFGFSANKTFKDNAGFLHDILVDPFIQNGSLKNYVYIEMPDNNGTHKKKPYVKNDILTSDYALIHLVMLKIISKKKMFFVQSQQLASIINTYFNIIILVFCFQV